MAYYKKDALKSKELSWVYIQQGGIVKFKKGDNDKARQGAQQQYILHHSILWSCTFQLYSSQIAFGLFGSQKWRQIGK